MLRKDFPQEGTALQIQRRADKFLEINNNYQEKFQEIYGQIFSRTGEINYSLQKIDEASEKIAQYITLCRKQAIRSNRIVIFVADVGLIDWMYDLVVTSCQ